MQLFHQAAPAIYGVIFIRIGKNQVALLVYARESSKEFSAIFDEHLHWQINTMWHQIH